MSVGVLWMLEENMTSNHNIAAVAFRVRYTDVDVLLGGQCFDGGLSDP